MSEANWPEYVKIGITMPYPSALSSSQISQYLFHLYSANERSNLLFYFSRARMVEKSSPKTRSLVTLKGSLFSPPSYTSFEQLLGFEYSTADSYLHSGVLFRLLSIVYVNRNSLHSATITPHLAEDVVKPRGGAISCARQDARMTSWS